MAGSCVHGGEGGFSRQEYWSGLPCPPPGNLPDPETQPLSLCLLPWQVGSLPLAHLGSLIKNSIGYDLTFTQQILFNTYYIQGTLRIMNEKDIVVALWDKSVCSVSHVQVFATPWTVAHQAPLSIDFSRQEYWSRLPFLLPGDLPDPRIKPTSLNVSCIGRQILYH